MKKIIVKKLISKNGFFDRELLIELIQPKRLKCFFVKKFYKRFLEIGLSKPPKQIKALAKISDMERIGQAYAPINFFSKLNFRLNKIRKK